MINKNSISIIGGAGHVGFPLGLAFADKKFKVNLIDLNKENLEIIKSGNVPFYEIGAKKILKNCLKKKLITTTNDLKTVKKSKYIIVCIGTPIDSKLKPETKTFLIFFKKLLKYVNKDQLIIIRSSVYPGIIDEIGKFYKKRKNNIVYCPERIVQSKSLVELSKLPQIVSGFDTKNLNLAKKLFAKICGKIIETSILEAELIKLFSNANRYINFSIANQLYIICNHFNLDFKRIRKIMRDGYERNLNLSNSGFTAGPCLLKDTMQLTSFYKKKFDLGFAAMKVNESLPDLIIKKLSKIKNVKNKKIGLLGLAFKAETDDIRDSLSIKLLKKLKNKKYKVFQSDEYYKDSKNINAKLLIKKSDVIILGAPHKRYKKLKISNKKKLIDVWGFFKTS
ncbi:MAG: hypothetical protein CBC24_00790 [Candidatus Pelagibacter sp. TMED64]|nr:nucleotide sugar dehydrogenase [Candidatus Pelagibacter sp.]OUU67566.1 MAG: hypothetical protein CBC24_00790 [Candidatus Pelagibacter sp. TMED64]|tara:strand:- start:1307 stop:2488 length:1182 start_codon:yes stop_codon:yes gene_type:complete